MKLIMQRYKTNTYTFKKKKTSKKAKQRVIKEIKKDKLTVMLNNKKL